MHGWHLFCVARLAPHLVHDLVDALQRVDVPREHQQAARLGRVHLALVGRLVALPAQHQLSGEARQLLQLRFVALLVLVLVIVVVVLLLVIVLRRLGGAAGAGAVAFGVLRRRAEGLLQLLQLHQVGGVGEERLRPADHDGPQQRVAAVLHLGRLVDEVHDEHHDGLQVGLAALRVAVDEHVEGDGDDAARVHAVARQRQHQVLHQAAHLVAARRDAAQHALRILVAERVVAAQLRHPLVHQLVDARRVHVAEEHRLAALVLQLLDAALKRLPRLLLAPQLLGVRPLQLLLLSASALELLLHLRQPRVRRAPSRHDGRRAGPPWAAATAAPPRHSRGRKGPQTRSRRAAGAGMTARWRTRFSTTVRRAPRREAARPRAVAGQRTAATARVIARARLLARGALRPREAGCGTAPRPKRRARCAGKGVLSDAAAAGRPVGPFCRGPSRRHPSAPRPASGQPRTPRTRCVRLWRGSS